MTRVEAILLEYEVPPQAPLLERLICGSIAGMLPVGESGPMSTVMKKAVVPAGSGILA
jgi:hypothetical protein